MVLSAFSINSGETSVKVADGQGFAKINESTIDRNTGELKLAAPVSRHNSKGF